MARAGEYRQRVQVQRPIKTADDYGELTEDGWETFLKNVPASIEPLRGQEMMYARQSHAKATHRVRMHYRPGINAGCRIMHRGRILNLGGPPLNIDEMDKTLEMTCEERGE